jgi:hypothetical protein
LPPRTVLLALLAACSAHGPEPSPPAIAPAREPAALPVLVPPAPRGADDPPRTTCRSTVPPSRHPLSHAAHSTEIAGRTFAVAWRHRGADVEAVIVSLDRAGALVETPVPVPHADPLAIGGDPRGLVIVSVAHRGRGTLLRVALEGDGALRPGQPTPLPDVAWGWPSAIESDGAVATVRHTLATPDQTRGADTIYTVDLATARVRATATPPAGATAHCHADACTTVELLRDDAGASGRATLTRRGPGGDATLDLTIASACPTLYPVLAGDELVLVGPGDPWRAALVSPAAPFLREAAIDPSLPAMPGCGRALYTFPSPVHPGLLDGGRGPRSLLTYDRARRSFGAIEALPEQPFPRTLHAAHPDGAIEVAWDGGSGLTHSPTDARGVRRYYRHWYFHGGQVGLLRREGGRWALVDVEPLALRDADGATHHGYTPLVLRHGAHAAVLLAPDGGGEAWLQPYLAPCAAP